MFRTVPGRLALMISVVVLLALAVSGTLLFRQLDQHFAARDRELTARKLDTVVRILSLNPTADREWLLGILGELSDLQLQVLPPDAVQGTPVVEQGVRLPQVRQRSPESAPGTAPLQALMQGQQVVGYLRADNLAPERQLAGQAVWRNLALVAAPTFLIGIAAGVLLSLGITRPLGRLTATAARMGEGALTERAPLAGPREMQTLAAQLNSMAADLDRSFATLVRERERLKRLISDLSHELKTPLTALMTFNELLAEAPEPLYIAESRRQLERLQWLIQTLLDLSRLDAGFLELNRRREPLQGVVDRVISALAPLGRQRGVTIAAEGDLAADVSHDGRWLEQALSNLVENALRFSPAEGHVRISLRRRPDALGLAVTDQGPGIAPEEQARLFERFYRGRNQPEGADRGSGLGLAVVAAVARAHGGEATVESEPGRGATFIVWLPESE